MKSFILAVVLLPHVSYGTIVTTVADEDNGLLGGGSGVSLREAVKYSPVGDTITFASGLTGQTLRLTHGEITVANSLTIDGSALPNRITLSGDKTGDGKTADDTRVINIATGIIVLDSLIITGGNCPTGSTATQGAGIYSNSSTTQLSIRNSTLTSNHAVSGGGIYFSGLLNSPNSLFQIQNCTFTGNTATNGGALYGREATATIVNSHFSGNSATGDGGAIWNRFNLDLATSTLSGNSAQRGGGIYQFLNTVGIGSTTFFGNSASAFGGGIYITGGSFTLRYSTLAGNFATSHGGGISLDFGTMLIESSTITANTAFYAAGIYSDRSFTANSSIIAANNSAPPADVSGRFSGSKNIAPFFTTSPPNPLLAPLGDYGGPTQTMPPLPGSPAIDMGEVTTLTSDQRGLSRVGSPDIGAAEFQGLADLARFWKLDFDGDGSHYGVEQALGTNVLVPDPTNSSNLVAPTFNVGGQAVVSFGLASTPAPGTRWILSRSPDLSLGSFAEIYRYDGTTDTAITGVSFLRTAASVTLTDENPLPGGGFYRFEAVLEP